MNKVSLIITTYNEAESISDWCKSLLMQTVQPDEVIIVDSCSTDSTVDIINKKFSNAPFGLKIIVQKCNISMGRNIAINNAEHENIAITDAGVTLVNNWLELMLRNLESENIVAGYYTFAGDRAFQKAYKSLFYKSSDEVDSDNFLPSSRSLALKKTCWRSVGGYDEKFEIGEDTDFDLKLKEEGYNIKFVPEASVEWELRKSLYLILKQQYKYSLWDGFICQNIRQHIFISIYAFVALILLVLSMLNVYIIPILFFYSLYPLMLKFKKRKKDFYDNLICKYLLTFLCPVSKGLGFFAGRVKALIRN